MKQILCIAVAAMVSFTAFAQENSIVGKWKIAKIVADGVTMNVEKPEELKATFAEQMKAAGQEVDDAQLDMVVSMMLSQFESVSYEYKADGTYAAVVPDESGSGATKNKTGTYTFDKATGKLTSTTKEGDKETVKTATVTFEGDYVTLKPSEDKAPIITFKKVK